MSDKICSVPETPRSASRPFSFDGDSALLAVRLTPRAGLDSIGAVVEAGQGRTALSVRVAAPPVDGAANKALVALLAKRLGIPKSAVTIASGETSRLKMVRLAGATADQLAGLF